MINTATAVFPIVTQRLLIRNMEPEDLDDFVAYRSNPDVVRFQSFDIMDRQMAKKFIAEHQNLTFGKPGQWVQHSIVHKESGKLIGDCAIKLDASDIRVAEIGITVSPMHQKQGFAREALSAIVNSLFTIPGLHRIVELVDTRNEASISMLEGCGFRREGHFIKSYDDNGVWTDEFQYALLRDDRISEI